MTHVLNGNASVLLTRTKLSSTFYLSCTLDHILQTDILSAQTERCEQHERRTSPSYMKNLSWLVLSRMQIMGKEMKHITLIIMLHVEYMYLRIEIPLLLTAYPRPTSSLFHGATEQPVLSRCPSIMKEQMTFRSKRNFRRCRVCNCNTSTVAEVAVLTLGQFRLLSMWPFLPFSSMGRRLGSRQSPLIVYDSSSFV